MQYRLSTIFLVFFVVAASLALFGCWGIWFAGFLCVAAYCLNRKEKLKDGISFSVVFVIIGIVCPLLLLPSVFAAREAARRANCTGLHLNVFGLGLHNFAAANKHFPPIYVRDKSGKPLWSWMVEILPNLGYDDLYKQLNKDEPWNSPHNAQVLPKIIDQCVCPSVNRDVNDCSTNYMAIIGPGTIWDAEGTKKLSDFPNSSSRTVVAVEVINSGKHWAEPFAVTVDEILENMRTGKGIRLSTCHPSGVNVLFADGGTRSFPTKMPLSLWRKILNGEGPYDQELASQFSPDATDIVDVYVEQNELFTGKITFILSVVVWLISAAWLFYRAVKSRKVIPQIAADAP